MSMIEVFVRHLMKVLNLPFLDIYGITAQKMDSHRLKFWQQCHVGATTFGTTTLS